jgi:hypothetical protein
MFDGLNDLAPPPADEVAIAARVRTLRRRRSSVWVIAGFVILSAGSMMAIRLQGDTPHTLVTTDGSSQVAGQLCLSSSLSANALWSAQGRTYAQPLTSPPTEPRVTEVQGSVTFTNTSDVPCSLEGAPSLAPLGADGQLLPVKAESVNCVPAPCRGRGAVVLPDGKSGILLAPQQAADSAFLWRAPYCGQGLGPSPRLRVSVSGGEPMDVSLVGGDPMNPVTQPSCDRSLPGAGGLQVHVFQLAPPEAAVTLYHCGVNPLLYRSRRWEASPTPFDSTNAPSTFTGHGVVDVVGDQLTYTDNGGAVITFKPDDGVPPPGCA